MEGGRNLAGFGEKNFCEGYSGQFLQGVGEEGVVQAGDLGDEGLVYVGGGLLPALGAALVGFESGYRFRRGGH